MGFLADSGKDVGLLAERKDYSTLPAQCKSSLASGIFVQLSLQSAVAACNQPSAMQTTQTPRKSHDPMRRTAASRLPDSSTRRERPGRAGSEQPPGRPARLIGSIGQQASGGNSRHRALRCDSASSARSDMRRATSRGSDSGAPQGQPDARRSPAARRYRRPAYGHRCPCCNEPTKANRSARPVEHAQFDGCVISARLPLDFDAGAGIFVERLAVALQRRIHRRHCC